MAFDKVAIQVDFPAQERALLRFWEEIQAFEKRRALNQGKPKWSFLDGPITANNPMGVHHAWGRTYKDAYQRYFAMTGHELRYQNGFDCQGLWVEVEVEKELGLRSKRDIENLVPGDPFASIDRFVQLCKQRVDKYARIQTAQSIRLGYWMDWDREEDWHKPPEQRRSYYTMSEENNYTIWYFLKKCHERGLIYRAYDAMPWCPRCAVGLSQMELHEGYQLVAHRAVFVRFPLRGRPGENLLVWTTTPWTLTSNVAAAVHPDLTYLRVRHRDQIYYLAQAVWNTPRLEEEWRRQEWVAGVPKLKTLEQLFRERGGYELLGEVPGAALVGWSYDGPFDELPAQQHPAGYPADLAEVVLRQDWGPRRAAADLHQVIPWKAVSAAEGTGIVHIAPGCGKEDFQLGRELRLVPVAPLDEYGVFLPGFGDFSGRSALDPATTDALLDSLRRKGLLLAVEHYPHNYPHCWRCRTELLFRLVDEWFISMSWREEIKRVTEQVVFLPEAINGKARELDWLNNMGDWMISKKRFWGLALPIWVCSQCGHFEVLGGRQELEARAIAGWDQFAGHTPHRPWIDLVQIRCLKCGGTARRIPDVGNPWLDAGIVPFSTLKYNTDRAYWEKWFPADFITESFPGQFRNWFYAILAMSTMLVQRPPVKVLLGHGLVRDPWGRPMHKTAGNAIPFEGAADEGYELTDPQGRTQHYPPMSADVIRWMFCRQNPASNINFGPELAEEVRSKLTLKLWNSYAFFCNYARLDGFDPAAPQLPLAERPDLDRWILSDLQHLIRLARQSFESFNVMTFCLEAERFVEDKLSNWYVRRNRRRFWKSEQGPDKLAAYQTLYEVLVTLTRLLAPIIPFLSEQMYQNLVVRGAGQGPESVHLCDYPQPRPEWIDDELSADMEALLRLVSLGSAARNQVKLKVRQPLAELRIQPANERERRAVQRFAEQLADELNVKKVTLHDSSQGPLLRPVLQANLRLLGPRFGPRLAAVQVALGHVDAAAAACALEAGQPLALTLSDGETITLGPEEVVVTSQAPEGWTGLAERGTQVALDVRLTEALKLEGLAREIVRHIQELRKRAGLEMDDRICLYLGAAAPLLQKAIQTHQRYITEETLTRALAAQPLGADAPHAEVKIEGQPLRIELRKMLPGENPA
jgi:isoleucyl-tRNA synthetase